MMSDFLIVLNGDSCVNLERLLSEATKISERLPEANAIPCFRILAADGGARLLRRAEVAAHAVIGDLDSLDDGDETWHAARDAQIIRVADQNENDFEKCYRYACEHGATRIFIAGFEGNRPDMVFALMARLSQGSPLPVPVILVGERQIGVPLQIGSHTFKGFPQEQVSLVSFFEQAEVELEGLQWSGSIHLEPGFQAVSNRCVCSRFQVRVNTGRVWLFRELPAQWFHVSIKEERT
jgi:thiamine pyrophosphokinase